jgi:hypothetical protein
MATKRLRDISITIELRGGRLTADASLTWDVPELPEVGTMHAPVALAVSPSDTVADLIARCDVAAETQLRRGEEVIEKPERPSADTTEGR